MNISAKSVRFDNNRMWIDLSDGHFIAVPLAGARTQIKGKAAKPGD